MGSGRGQQKMNCPCVLRPAQVYHRLRWEGFRSCTVRTACLNYDTAVVWSCIWDTRSSTSRLFPHRVTGWPHSRPDKTGGEYNYARHCARQSYIMWISARHCLNYDTAVVWSCIWDTRSSTSRLFPHRVTGWPHSRPDKIGGEYNYARHCARPSYITWVSALHRGYFLEANRTWFDAEHYDIT